MLLTMKRKMKWISPLFVVLIALISLNLASFGAGNCEEALYLCWLDHWWEGFDGVFYCVFGYIFCKKYIESTV